VKLCIIAMSNLQSAVESWTLPQCLCKLPMKFQPMTGVGCRSKFVVGSALIAHLCQVERSVVDYADRVIRKTPFHVPYLQRFRVPFVVVEKRLDPRKIADPVDEELFAVKRACC